jgi:hypothetical protein
MFIDSTLTRKSLVFFVVGLCLCCCGEVAEAQTTGFTYQGKLADSGTPASGNYDFEFRLFDAVSGGTQQGTTQTLTNVAVASGIFTVGLDFGACATCFNGAPRFLDISVRVAGGGAYTPLTPRQPITATPYAIKTQNLAFNGTYNDGGMPPTIFTASNTFAGDSAGLNTIPDPNPTNINGKLNSFFGAGAGQANTTGFFNSFFGIQAGQANNFGHYNSFFGSQAGFKNSGFFNSFFGSKAGLNNTTGSQNAFFGTHAGFSNTTGRSNSFFGGADGGGTGSSNTIGNFNSFFGHRAGEKNVDGNLNSFFGTGAGFANISGGSNTFLGHDAGNTNTTGSFNTVIGESADVGLNNLINATAIGANAQATQSNSLVLGSINGINLATADTNVGIGTTAPEQKLHVVGNEILSTGASAGFKFRDRGSSSSADDWVWYSNGNLARFFRAGVGDLLTITTDGVVALNTLGSAGGSQLCRNASNQIANCSSSIRYKTNLATLHTGLNLINRLRPVTFNWKQNGEHDLGLVAEEVAKVEPLLVTHNNKGEIEGVKYDRVSVVLVNAVKEQQAQIVAQQAQIGNQQRLIERQQQQLNEQQQALAALKKLVCSSHRKARACK